MPSRPLRVVLALICCHSVPLGLRSAQAECDRLCWPDVPPGASYYGGTIWAADSARWEAIPGGAWTFDSGVGSALTVSPNKPAGYHSIMEGWEGVLLAGSVDYTNFWDLSELPDPLVSCVCAMQDTVLALFNPSGDHSNQEINFAASPWIELSPGDLGRTGRVILLDAYAELVRLNYVFFKVYAKWKIDGSESGWTTDGRYHFDNLPICTTAGNPAVIDLSAVIPAAAEEIRIGLGVENLCDIYPDCTTVSNTSPWIDNVRFGVYDAVSYDADGDGATDAEEDGAPNSGDGNNDGSLDRLQNHVVSRPGTAGPYFVLVGAPMDPPGLPRFLCSEAIDPVDLPAPPEGVGFPCGLLGFRTQLAYPATSTMVTIFLDPICRTGLYYKFGPEPGNLIDHWYDFESDGSTGAAYSPGKVTLRFKDGDRGDARLTAVPPEVVADGWILDPGGPADDGTVGLPDGDGGAGRGLLLRGSPNPFGETILLSVGVSGPGAIRLTIYDIAGRTVRNLVAPEATAGRVELVWDGRNERGEKVKPGLYLVRFKSGGREETLRVVYLQSGS